MQRRIVSRHSPSMMLLALGCVLTMYYIQYIFKQYFILQLQQQFTEPTLEPTSTLRPITATTSTPTQQQQPRPHLFYSFRGNSSKHLYPQQHDNLYVGETDQDYIVRFAQWQVRLHNLPFGGPRTHFTAWPIAFETPTLLVRSAFALTDVLYISIALSKPPTTKRVRSSSSPLTFWDNSPPTLSFSSCKLVSMENGSLSKALCGCTVNSNMAYNDRILITLDEPVDLDPNKQWVFSLISGSKSFILPIERITRQEQQPDQVHLCTQGVLYTELQYGPMPDDHYESFIGHYARFGITDLHLYTNSSAHAAHAILQSARLVAGNKMRIWIHDTLLAELVVPRSALDAVENGFQLFAINDCLHRAHAMGASAVMYGDLDEYSFPTKHDNHQEGLLVHDYIAKELAALGSSTNDPVVLYQNSYIFNTLYCANATSPYITNRYTVSMLDTAAYAGRRKAIFVYNQVPASTLVRNIHLSVHDTSGAVQTHRAQYLHLHHYREGWHPQVCLHDASKAQPPWDNISHANCDCNLPPITRER